MSIRVDRTAIMLYGMDFSKACALLAFGVACYHTECESVNFTHVCHKEFEFSQGARIFR